MSAPPLRGVRVLSFEQYGAGPFGTQYLADLGAEVIKIEPPGGDYARGLGPYYTDDDQRRDGGSREPEHDDDASLFFQSFNRNKKSVTLDLAEPAAVEVLHRLVASADATADNLRGDVPRKLGLCYDSLAGANPAVVCAHCSAYGRDGPRRDWPGYDYLMQAEAGYFFLSGEPDAPPARLGLSVVDYMAGQNMALALLAALLAARASGRGRDVDVNLFDTALAGLGYLGNWALNSDYRPGRAPRSAHPSLVPCQLYRSADGWIYLMLNKAAFWPRLCRLLGRPELARDPRYSGFAERLARLDELTRILDGLLQARTTAEWLQRFAGRIPAAPVLDPRQALANPYVAERGRTQTMRDRRGHDFRLLAPSIDAGHAERARPAPALGEHTDEVLRSAGYDEQEIARLRAAAIVS